LECLVVHKLIHLFSFENVKESAVWEHSATEIKESTPSSLVQWLLVDLGLSFRNSLKMFPGALDPKPASGEEQAEGNNRHALHTWASWTIVKQDVWQDVQQVNSCF
jgi:hypothetical protein